MSKSHFFEYGKFNHESITKLQQFVVVLLHVKLPPAFLSLLDHPHNSKELKANASHHQSSVHLRFSLMRKY